MDLFPGQQWRGRGREETCGHGQEGWGVGSGARRGDTLRVALADTRTASGACCTAQRAQLSAPRRPSRAGGSAGREGTHVYAEMIHLVVQQKLTQHCKAIILQSKRKNPVEQAVYL